MPTLPPISDGLLQRWKDKFDCVFEILKPDTLVMRDTLGDVIYQCGTPCDDTGIAQDYPTQGVWLDQSDGQDSRLSVVVRAPDGAAYALIQILAHRSGAFSKADQSLVLQMRDSIEDQISLAFIAAADDNALRTALERSEAARKLSELRLRLMIENTLDDFFIHDQRGQFLDVNERACRSLGYSREELLRMTVLDISQLKPTAEQFEIWDTTPPGAVVMVQVEHTHKDGSLLPVEIMISCHMLEGQKIFIGQARDISPELEVRKTLENLNAELERRVTIRTQEVNEASARLEAILDTVDDAIILRDTQGRLQQINRAASLYLGCDPQLAIGKTLTELLDAGSAQTDEARLAEVMDSGQAVTSIEPLPEGLGQGTVLITRSPRKNAKGDIEGIVSISRDITAQQSAENDLRLERERLSLAAMVGKLGIGDYRIADRRLVPNDELLEMFDLVGETPDIELLVARVHPDQQDLFYQQFERVSSGLDVNGISFRVVARNGAIRWISASARHIATDDPALNRIIAVFRDVTHSKVAESRLQESYDLLLRAERMARIGSWRLSPADGAFWSSEMMLELNGIPTGELITVEKLSRMMPEDDFKRVGASINRCIETGESYSLDVTHYRPEGGSFAANIRGQAIYDADGRLSAVAGTVQDISEREAARAQIAAIADSLPHGAIYRLDYLSPELGKGENYLSTIQLSYISAGIEHLTGYRPEEMIADPSLLINAVHPDDRERYLEASRIATVNGTNFDCEFRLHKNDGTMVWAQVRAAPRAAEGGRIWDGIIMDVTAAHEAAQALQKAKEHAEAAERAKSDFLATMSHEIRTPMNAVIGMTRLTLQTELSARQRNYLEKIDNSARTLIGIINDTLDFSRIEAGALELEEVEFSLETVLETLTNATTLKAEEKGLEIIYSVSPRVPRVLRGDPLRLGQILINLLGNAVKFTDKGEIEVSIERDPLELDLIRFSVRDTGIGMDESQLSHIFQPFTQAEHRTARQFGGTGLGLTISKRLVELMGGSISVSSRPGRGSLFSFGLPQAESLTEDVSKQKFAGFRALIVDDVATVRESLRAMVADMGFQTQVAASGPEALSALSVAANRDKPFDLVLMDWQMPEMDGVETARRIRESTQLRTTPAVLMVTAHAREEISRYVDQLELQGLLIKPVTQSTMFNALHPIFFARNLRPTPTSSERIIYPSSLKGRRVLVVDDNLFNLEVASDFLELAEMDVYTATSGYDALDRLAEVGVDIVLMDMQMPGIDGIETTRRIRENPAWATLPVVALTAQARIEDFEATKRVGMIEHLTKPIDETHMFATIARILAESDAAPAADPAPLHEDPSPDSGPAPRVVIDISHTLARVRGDTKRLRRMLELFLRDFTTCPEDLRSALSRIDSAAIAVSAHRLSGIAGYFGASELTTQANNLETRIFKGELQDLGPLTLALIAELELVLAACNDALSNL